MKIIDTTRTSTRLAAINPEAMDHYQKMRAQVMPAPGVDAARCETMLAMQLAVLGLEIPFKIHAKRAMALAVTREQLQGLLLAGLGVTLVATQVGHALAWLDEAAQELRQAAD